MLAEFEKCVAFALVQFLQPEKILIEFDRLFDVAYFDGDVITAVDLHAHDLHSFIAVFGQRQQDVQERALDETHDNNDGGGSDLHDGQWMCIDANRSRPSEHGATEARCSTGRSLFESLKGFTMESRC